MHKELFERLLYEDESTTLDFKKEQYRFVKATDDEKSELLKDILGFANAWRRSEAYILIGVEEARGAPSIVTGIPATDHLDDHSLQQFVNCLTNQPVRFGYETFVYEGKQVGIIRIHEQIRPIYLKRDYGKLKEEKVYVRRGSSTDPNKPASIEEIAQMRIGTDQPSAELQVEFAHVDRDEMLGQRLSWNAEFCKMPAKEGIPDFSVHEGAFLSGVMWPATIDPYLNRDFYRELASYEYARRFFRPVRLVVRNIGQVAAENVRVELVIPTGIEERVLVKADLPEQPKQRNAIPHISDLRIAINGYPGKPSIENNDIAINCDDLQPGRKVWSDVFYIGKMRSGEISLRGTVFADNLPRPKEFTRCVSVIVSQSAMSIDELCALPESTTEDD